MVKIDMKYCDKRRTYVNTFRLNFPTRANRDVTRLTQTLTLLSFSSNMTLQLNDQEFPRVFKIIFDPLVADVEKRLNDLILTVASPDYHTVKIAQIYFLQQSLS